MSPVRGSTSDVGRPRFRGTADGWKPLDRVSLVVLVMQRDERDWLTAYEIAEIIGADQQLKEWWDELPSRWGWAQQKIYLSTQNVKSRLYALRRSGAILYNTGRDEHGYVRYEHALVTPALREKMRAELRERLRIPEDLREAAFVAAQGLGVEVETRVGPPETDGEKWQATARLIVHTKRGTVEVGIEARHDVSDEQIREEWQDLLKEAGLL